MFAVYVTYILDSVWHAILDNFRPVSVWITQLVLFQITAQKFGEKWSSGSYLQLAGLVLLLFGTAVYNANYRFSCFKYEDEEEEELVFGRVLERKNTTLLTQSPFLTSRRFTKTSYSNLLREVSEELHGPNGDQDDDEYNQIESLEET